MDKVNFINSIMDKMIQDNGRCKICDTPTASFLKDENYEVDKLILNACNVLEINPYKEFNTKEKEYLTYIIAGMLSTHKHIWLCEECLELVEKQTGDSIVEKIINATKQYVVEKGKEEIPNDKLKREY